MCEHNFDAYGQCVKCDLVAFDSEDDATSDCEAKKIWTHDDDGRVGFVDPKSGCFITDPFVSSCGRFEVDPVEEYDLDADLACQLIIANGALQLES